MTDRPQWQLSGFGDEIDADPRIQAAVLAALGASHIEVRSAWGVNIIDLEPERQDELRRLLTEAGLGTSAIASPVGKVDVDDDGEPERLDRAIAAAQRLGAGFVRIFSYYHPGRTPEQVRDAVLRRMSDLAARAAGTGVVCVLENEKDLYGDRPERVADVIESVGSPDLQVAWDAANFVQVGVARPFDEGYPLLRPYLVYLQVKDAKLADGSVVAAGEGDGQVAETVAALAADGYRGFASLEPHLAAGFTLGGFSGPKAFGLAARAFRSVTDQAGVDLQ